MKTMIAFGTRPEIIKLAPVVHKLRERFDVAILHTGQHVELAEDVLEFFRMQPTCHGDCMTDHQAYEEKFRCMIETVNRCLADENPDIVIVQGDTMTTYAAAFASFLQKKPVLHLEAGLRTYSKYAPFPEEVYRTLVSRIADFHFAPTIRAYDNLIREGIRQDRVLLAGNTIVDAVLMVLHSLDRDAVMRELSLYRSDFEEVFSRKELVLITSHRRENIGTPLKDICAAVKALSEKYHDKLFLWILHKNPEVREIVLEELSADKDNVILAEALTYPAMVFLMQEARLILTDSGGIQEEAAALKKRVLILREVTERQEIVESGLGLLVGVDTENIIQAFCSSMERNDAIDESASNPFGDGKTSERLLDFLSMKEIRTFLAEYPQSADRTLTFKRRLKTAIFP